MAPYPSLVGDLPGWLQALSSVVGGVGLGFLVWLLIYGPLGRRSDCDARLEAQKAAHEHEIVLINDAHADALTALNLAMDNRVKSITLRLDGVIEEREQLRSDKEAWRAAYTEEAGARRAAETATRQLMESTNVTAALLSALKDAMARTLPPHDREGQ